MKQLTATLKWRNMLAALLLITLSLPSVAMAQSLLLAPTRLVFEGKSRKGSLQVSNPSDEEAKYRVEILNRRMSKDGQYTNVETPEAGELFADKIVRISPRSFTLGPKSSQTIRVHVRKPKNLEDGEYRSHIRVQVLPKSTGPKIGEVVDGINIQVKVNYGMVIPLIVRKGELDYDIKIEQATITKDPKTGDYTIKTTFARTGKRSAYGDISLVHKAENGEEHILKFLPGLSVFYPNKTRTFSIPLGKANNVSLESGTLEITYRAQKKDGGELIAKYSQQLNNGS